MPEPDGDEEERRQQQDVVAFLRRLSLTSGGDGAPAITPTSRIFFVGDRVYKLKRARRLPFLDHRPVDKRRAVCLHEVELNRRTAPDLYRGVVAVTRQQDGLALDGDGPAVDWLVEMRRFDRELQTDRLAARGAFTIQHAAALADRITAFHQGLGSLHDKGRASAMAQSLRNIRTAIGHAPSPRIAQAGQVLADRLLGLTVERADGLEARRVQGKVRLCHGDMHLGNIVVLDGVPTPFDCVEFDDDIAAVDTLFDLAFPIMDLLRHDLPDAASLLLNRALAASGDYDGLSLLPLYLAARALIRAMSEGLNGRADAATRYLDTADAVLAPQAPRLLAVGGLSGSGKSSVARALAPHLGAPPGAILLRSDEIRKRMLGIVPEQKLPQDAYKQSVTRRVFARMADFARTALGAGATVILDATHMDPAQREAAEALAAEAGISFTGLWFDAPPELLLERVGGRTGDMSDAGTDVLRAQFKADLGAIGWRRIDASRDLNAVIAASRAAIDTSEPCVGGTARITLGSGTGSDDATG